MEEIIINLKDRLDEIDDRYRKIFYEGHYKMAFNNKMGQWEKGQAVNAEHGGADSASYYQLEKETGRQRESLKKWHALFLKYPTLEKYLPVAEREAKAWATKQLNQGPTVALGMGNQENYTPFVVISAVRQVLGGIDLDPASCKLAQATVGADTYYTEEENGLLQPWFGRVFLNPPYQHPLIEEFTDKLIGERPNIDSAILLTNNNTDTGWFRKSALASDLVCFTEGRINFYTQDIEKTQPTNGQAFFYFGTGTERFTEIFSKQGLVVKVIK